MIISDVWITEWHYWKISRTINSDSDWLISIIPEPMIMLIVFRRSSILSRNAVNSFASFFYRFYHISLEEFHFRWLKKCYRYKKCGIHSFDIRVSKLKIGEFFEDIKNLANGFLLKFSHDEISNIFKEIRPLSVWWTHP